jgi:orotidine-5'-phosphate decarboxylase
MIGTESQVDAAVRARLAIALDLPDLDAAAALAESVAPWIGVAKVGLELFSAAGPEAVERMQALGLQVFLDLKLHDIPTTVGRAARVLGALGVDYLNLHAAGGEEMLRAGVEGLAEGARAAGHSTAAAIAVTVLTSDPDASAFDDRLRVARLAGCAGVVCSVREVARVRAADASLITIVPGVRFEGADAHDQARVGTPEEVASAGATIMVLGRAVTAAPDPSAAARRAFEGVATTPRA